MFEEAITFNQPLEQWNVSEVCNMKRMFSRAKAFQQRLDEWDVS